MSVAGARSEDRRSQGRRPFRGRRRFQAAVLGWYDARGRTLPFRGTRDPYAILVSEVMAQQTQISRVGPAWEAFLERFPSFGALAGASLADVLRAWQGLGYDRRALNLQRTARIVMEEHGGRLPSEVAELERLPGIGPYTARAVAAIAFGAPVGAVDTNVRRVLGRVVVGSADALRPAELQALADGLVPMGRAADWTHAVMDVGATHCRSTRPLCGDCPARGVCRYVADGRAAGSSGGRRPVSTGPSRGAGGQAGDPAPGRSAQPFERTSRWLRGRILDRARSADGAAWTRYDDPIGSHPHEVVVATLAALGGEGMLELAPADRCVARLPPAMIAGDGIPESDT